MNYIQESNAFREWIYRNSPSTGQIALWYALFDLCNKTGWKEWFNAPSITLSLGTGLSRQSIINCRDYLVEHGLIEVRVGRQNTAAEYKMISFFACKNLGIQVDIQLVNEVVNEVKEVESASQNLGIQLAQNWSIPKQETKTKEYMSFDDMPHVTMTTVEYEKLVKLLGNEEKVMTKVYAFASWILNQPPKKQKTASAYLTITNWHKRDKEKLSDLKQKVVNLSNRSRADEQPDFEAAQPPVMM